jgi:hypothetical protein
MVPLCAVAWTRIQHGQHNKLNDRVTSSQDPAGGHLGCSLAKRIAFAASTSWPKTLEQLGIVGQLYQVCTDGGGTKGMAGNVIYTWRRHFQYEVLHRKFQE